MIARLMAALGRVTSANRLLSAALLVLCLGGSVGMYQVGQKLSDISDRIHPGAPEEQRRLKAQLKIDALVDDALGGLGEDIDADRALVWLAHNGQTDLTGRIPFMFISNVHAYLRPGLAWEERWSRPVPLSAVSGSLRRMFRDPENPRCIRVDRGDADVSALSRSRLADRGVEVVFLCPIVSAHGVVGIAAAEYLHREAVRLGDSDVLGRLAATTQHVQRALTETR
jgi:hypothetical protein